MNCTKTITIALGVLLSAVSIKAQNTKVEDDPKFFERLDEWEGKMKPFVSGSNEAGFVLDFKKFCESLPAPLKNHYKGVKGAKLPKTNLDVRAIAFLRQCIDVGNVERPKLLKRMQIAIDEARTIAKVSCCEFLTNDSFTSIEVKATGSCANFALQLIGWCQGISGPFGKLGGLYQKAKDHYAKCGYQGFKIKYYWFSGKFNIGC